MRAGQRRKLRLGKTLFLLPNLITLSSLFCGFDAIRLAALGGSANFYQAAVLLIFAMVFDMLDGRVARMTKTQSAFGVQIDSLADLVSFGVAPALIVYQWTSPGYPGPALAVAFLFTACSAVRLARFNVITTDTSGQPHRPGKYITGLPTPGAAGILISIVIAHHAVHASLEGLMLPLMVIAGGLSILMVSTVRFRSFKDIKLNARTIAVVAFVVGSSAVVSARLNPAFVLVWLLGFYVMLALAEAVWRLSRGPSRATHDSIPPPPVPPSV